jgi:hypothetical protein
VTAGFEPALAIDTASRYLYTDLSTPPGQSFAHFVGVIS